MGLPTSNDLIKEKKNTSQVFYRYFNKIPVGFYKIPDIIKILRPRIATKDAKTEDVWVNWSRSIQLLTAKPTEIYSVLISSW